MARQKGRDDLLMHHERAAPLPGRSISNGGDVSEVVI